MTRWVRATLILACALVLSAPRCVAPKPRAARPHVEPHARRVEPPPKHAAHDERLDYLKQIEEPRPTRREVAEWLAIDIEPLPPKRIPKDVDEEIKKLERDQIESAILDIIQQLVEEAGGPKSDDCSPIDKSRFSSLNMRDVDKYLRCASGPIQDGAKVIMSSSASARRDFNQKMSQIIASIDSERKFLNAIDEATSAIFWRKLTRVDGEYLDYALYWYIEWMRRLGTRDPTMCMADPLVHKWIDARDYYRFDTSEELLRDQAILKFFMMLPESEQDVISMNAFVEIDELIYQAFAQTDPLFVEYFESGMVEYNFLNEPAVNVASIECAADIAFMETIFFLDEGYRRAYLRRLHADWSMEVDEAFRDGTIASVEGESRPSDVAQ